MILSKVFTSLSARFSARRLVKTAFLSTIIVAAPAAYAADGDTPGSSASLVAAMPSAAGGKLDSADRLVPADPNFRALFSSWQQLDKPAGQVLKASVPSQRPVSNLVFTSNFGLRSDPFTGARARHAGVDIAGPLGTPIYATADGLIGRAQRVKGYGNLIEVNHGAGIQTRYGHLSQILVQPNMPVKKGDLIGLMGSTGRSTGNHLHYEVRLNGAPVNPIPFLEANDYVMAARASNGRVAMGGPEVPARK